MPVLWPGLVALMIVREIQLSALRITETDGSSYELRLYDNGIKDSKNEIVLEKAYPDGDRDTELLDFYLADGKGNVTDEQKTTW